ncbi:protein-methionine-sulfoxide reductase catalytic subunit MsrP [Paracoccus suum]|uniref:Protein-methionine-sulfoxide reductase catalytic subunit MsrP n=1 Tax=Paracoccus suum TaxID=2259340 RepID=A0A344PHW6_9RHOB|nr:protein-methionine-sulfoxide reductase catalytic subunit MsrP [Paracoccus suum]AXC48971.1 protein-methionine-sulfoxide reductase catalytic subunit MsrP [Paracoccus suum]
MRPTWSDVTPEAIWLNRRALLRGGLGLGAAAVLAGPAAALSGKASKLSTDATPNTFEEISNYNNYIEFGNDKTTPATNAQRLKTEGWTVAIDGLVDHPGTYSVDQIAPENALEQRIYRLRCVEAWSMVVPWIGVPLGPVLGKAGPQSAAKFVAFESAWRPDEMTATPGLYQFPYREGLRLDEAMNPLTLLATGLYDKPMPKQNGAPIRLIVPWKYGFKSIKSIVRITLTDKQPVGTWQAMQPSEYGFYANVNPAVDHPRWSQATERVIGAGLFAGRKDTLPFNGYGDEVASLYTGQDLAKDY